MQLFNNDRVKPRTVRQAKRAIRRFEKAVIKHNYFKLLNLVSKRWNFVNKKVKLEAKITLMFRELLIDVTAIKIIAIDFQSNVMMDIIFELEIFGVQKNRYTLRFIKESKPYKVSTYCKFRYEPSSMKLITTQQ